MIYPIRINKYLAEEKICSRREADRLIKQGKVKVNGTQAQLGEKICETDKITIDGDLKNLVYVAFNKPKGVVVHSSQEGETSIKDILKLNFEVFPLGRLEKDSSGLVLLTNDGRVTDRLLNPEYHHEKKYKVKLNKAMDENFIKSIEEGVELEDGYVTGKCVLKVINDFNFLISSTESKNRQIKKMCRVLNSGTADLEVVRIMNIELSDLNPGEYRMIEGEELEDFLVMLGL